MKISGLLILLVLTSLLRAQEYESFFEEFDVVLHQLQVNVVDRDGLTVPDLKKEDFELSLNGKLQEIESVQEINLESAVMEADRNNRNIPEQARRLFVFFFDLRYSTRKGVLDGQKAAREFVMTSMLPSDLVGVFTYTQLAGISMATNFTNDINHLLDAIDTLGLSAARNVAGGPSGYILDGMLAEYAASQGIGVGGELAGPGATGGTTTGGFAQGQAGTFASQHLEEMFRLARDSEKKNYDREVLSFLTSMEKFGDGLRFIRGRKNLIWFSSGFDATSLLGVSDEKLRENAEYAMLGLYERVSSDQLGRGDIQSEARRVVESLQASGTVVFSVDTSRIDQMSSEKQGLQTLSFFSNDTGGRVFSNRNQYLDVINEIQAITNHYYLVSFYPGDVLKKKKEVGSVKLKVKNNGRARVYTNKGLLLAPDFMSMTRIEKDIHIAEYIARDQVIRGVPLNVSIVAVPTSGELLKLSATTEISGDYFLHNQIRKNKREMEVFTIAVEEATNRVFDQSYFKFTVDINRGTSILEKTGIKYFSQVFVKPGNYRLKVVVRDLISGKIGSWIEKVAVEGGPNHISGPVMITDDTWLMVRQPEAQARNYKTGNLDFSYPFQMGSQILVPAIDPVVGPDKNIKLLYLLDYRESVGNQKKPTIQLMFMDKHDRYIMIPPEAVTVDMELLEDAPHLTRMVLIIDQNRLHLAVGETYKFLAYFAVENQPALRSISEITIADL